MIALLSIGFCIFLGFMIHSFGLMALIWVPVGYAVGVFYYSQIFLPIFLGIPRAIGLKQYGKPFGNIIFRIIGKVALWIIIPAVALIIIGALLPNSATWFSKNFPLNFAMNLGMLTMLLSPLSETVRDDYRKEFDETYD